jgi:RNA polymerase sigma-70 factor (sigma-E family)
MTRSSDVGVDGVVGTGSFDGFFRSEYGSVLGLAIALCGDRWAAEDLTQEAFAAAERRWGDVGELDRPGAWVRRVVANKSVSRWRRQISETTAWRRMPDRRSSGSDSDPHLSAEAEELWAAVRKLPKRQCQVVALTYLDGLSTSEVGQVLGCSAPTVKTHLQRGRATLARRLGMEEER